MSALSPSTRRDLASIQALSSRIVAGLMTGTSMDGLDIALVRVPAGLPRTFELLAQASTPMPEPLRAALAPQGDMTAAAVAQAGRLLGLWYADEMAALVARSGLVPDLIGVHGQTIFHAHGLTTLQIGEPSYLAERMCCPVVADFRQGDIAAGGCGAPLVPIVDQWLLQDPEEGVVALNIGGIANLTAVPAASAGDIPAIGFDCGPGNMIIDGLARRFTAGVQGGAQQVDWDGAFAARGARDPDLLARLMAHPFLAAPPPRSAGREQFGQAYVDALVAEAAPSSPQDWFDLIRTATCFTAAAVAASLDRFVRPQIAIHRLLVSGGGARNPVLMQELRAALPDLEVTTTDARGLAGDMKEAIAFALLASARIDNIPANLPAVTGARRPVLLGKIVEV